MANPSSAGTFYSHLMTILASVVCATGVWLVVQLTNRDDITLEVAIVQESALDSSIIFDFLESSASVTFTVPTTELAKMDSDHFRIYVPVSEIPKRMQGKLEDEGAITLTKNMLRPTNTAIIDLEAQNIIVTEILLPQVGWEARKRSIKAMIVPTISGSPPEGFTYDPDSAEVREGPVEVTAVLDLWKQEELQRDGVKTLRIETMPLDITGKTGVVRGSVALNVPEGVRVFPPDAAEERTVSINIYEIRTERVIENVPITYEFVSTEELKATFNPPTVAVRIEGKQSAVNKVTPEMLTARVYEVVERPGDTREVAVETRFVDRELTRDLRIVETTPRSVRVTIESTAPATPTPEPTATRPPAPTPSRTPPPPTPSPAPTATPEPTVIPPTVSVDDRPTS